MVEYDAKKYIKHYLNIENDLLLTFNRNEKFTLIFNKNIIDIHATSEMTYSAPLYINKEESNLSL